MRLSYDYWVTIGRHRLHIAYILPTVRPRFSKEYAFLTHAGGMLFPALEMREIGELYALS